MKLAVFAAVLVVSTPLAGAGQTRRPATPPAPARPAPDRTAEAYEQFLQAHLLQDEDADAAIAAYRRAMTLDPASADIPADLAELYMRENKPQDAIQAAEQALRVSPENRDAHRVLGTVYASLAGRPGRAPRDSQQQNVANAIRHLEQAFDPPMSAADANLRAMLARLYIANESYDKAIPVLADLVKQ
jgi:tetratricopeptide (TPR) repeat protein